ncbi:MAG: hypothetical protein C4303_07390 [candidate division GAL15 bacterium]
MVRFGWVAWILALLLAAPLAAQTGLGDIVPGEAIGGARIGMGMDEAAQVAQAFGQTRDQARDAGREVCNVEDGVGICAYDYYFYEDEREPTKTPGLVLAVVTDDPRFRLKGGVGVGSTLLEFLGAYAANPEWLGGGYLEWTSKGLLVGLRRGARGAEVALVGVFKPRPSGLRARGGTRRMVVTYL